MYCMCVRMYSFIHIFIYVYVSVIGFGWLKDPVLMEVQRIIDAYQLDIPWTSAVPGATVNWTTVEDTRRRRWLSCYLFISRF